MNTNLIHTWLRNPRFASETPTTDEAEVEDATFFPIEITGVSSTSTACLSSPASSNPLTAHRVDIALSDGRRILVEGTTALSAIVAMVEALAQ